MAVKFPFGPADVQALTGTGTKAVTVYDLLTILNLSTMTGAITINLTFGDAYHWELDLELQLLILLVWLVMKTS